jgi:hypothetical protein
MSTVDNGYNRQTKQSILQADDTALLEAQIRHHPPVSKANSPKPEGFYSPGFFTIKN